MGPSRRAVERLQDHWSWEPEWTRERPRYLWYLTFEDQPRLAEVATEPTQALTRTQCVDVVPPRWRHLTLADIGFVDEVDEPRAEAVNTAVRETLADQPPLRLELGPVVTLGDSVVLAAGPVEPLSELRERVVRATFGAGAFPRLQTDPVFAPHVSLCYLNGRTDAAAVLDVLESLPETTAEVTCDRVTQALVSRTDGHYRWRARAELRLGRTGATARR
jgi:2'-5' RNA ligase